MKFSSKFHILKLNYVFIIRISFSCKSPYGHFCGEDLPFLSTSMTLGTKQLEMKGFNRAFSKFLSVLFYFISVQFSSIQFSSVQFSSDSSVQFSSVQFSSVQFSSVQFSSVHFILV